MYEEIMSISNRLLEFDFWEGSVFWIVMLIVCGKSNVTQVEKGVCYQLNNWNNGGIFSLTLLLCPK